ncbi:hypothetical protein NPX13_g7548 [Xylaria arbuscula]|uniref:Uncharacterized protein n=1 Tax=Xylaria arbuscula TaxID=114810 RepID=A0A9W8TJ49_9PEZI|nr:hypothetical protein NPX13_g7548 [Xylaria arbuscula]
MKATFALTALAAGSLSAAYNVKIAPTEYTQLAGLSIVAENGGFSVTNKGTPANFAGGDDTLTVSGQQGEFDSSSLISSSPITIRSPGYQRSIVMLKRHTVFVDARGRVGYGQAPQGSTLTGWSKDAEELHWTRGAIFACPNVSFNVGIPTAYHLYANWEATRNGQGDDCFSIHLAVAAS